MRTVNEREAVKVFGQVMTPFIDTPPATGVELFEAFARFHREVRVRGVDDSVMLKCGAMTPHLLNGFTDLRVADFDWDKVKYRWLGLSRRLKSANGDGDGDTALRVFMYFGRSTGDEPSSNVEFDGLDRLEAAFRRFTQVPYVADLLAEWPSRVTAFVGEVG